MFLWKKSIQDVFGVKNVTLETKAVSNSRKTPVLRKKSCNLLEKTTIFRFQQVFWDIFKLDLSELLAIVFLFRKNSDNETKVDLIASKFVETMLFLTNLLQKLRFQKIEVCLCILTAPRFFIVATFNALAYLQVFDFKLDQNAQIDFVGFRLSN